MSSTDPVIVGVLQTMDASWKALRDAHQALADSTAIPDRDDLAETATLVGAVAESLMKVNGLLIGRYVAN